MPLTSTSRLSANQIRVGTRTVGLKNCAMGISFSMVSRDRYAITNQLGRRQKAVYVAKVLPNLFYSGVDFRIFDRVLRAAAEYVDRK